MILKLVKFGFSVGDIKELDNIDIRIKQSILQDVEKEAEIERIINRMYVAEAVRVGELGAMKTKKFDGFSIFKKWWRKQRRLIKKLSGKKVYSVWDNIRPGKSRRF